MMNDGNNDTLVTTKINMIFNSTTTNSLLLNDTSSMNHTSIVSSEHSSNVVSTVTVSMDSDINWIVVGSMIGLLVILIVTFIVLIMQPLNVWYKNRKATSPERLKKRYETIEGWLITKRIIEHPVTTDSTNSLGHYNFCIVCSDSDEGKTGSGGGGSTTNYDNKFDHQNTSTDIEMGYVVATIRSKGSNNNNNNDDDKENASSASSSPSKKGQFRRSIQILSCNANRNTATGSSYSTHNPTEPKEDATTNNVLNKRTIIKTIGSMDTADTVPSVQDDNEPSNNEDITERSNEKYYFDNNNDIECCTNGSKSNECPICMEPFDTIGTIVSWSPNKLCDHVFHHECIKEWLIHHDTCPYCRNQFLLIDSMYTNVVPDQSQSQPTNNDNNTNNNSYSNVERSQQQTNESQGSATADNQESLQHNQPPNNNNNNNNLKSEYLRKGPWTTEQLQLLARERMDRYNTTYYCVEHGLIQLSNVQLKEISSRSKTLRKQALSSGIDNVQLELQKLRPALSTESDEVNETTTTRRYGINVSAIRNGLNSNVVAERWNRFIENYLYRRQRQQQNEERQQERANTTTDGNDIGDATPIDHNTENSATIQPRPDNNDNIELGSSSNHTIEIVMEPVPTGQPASADLDTDGTEVIVSSWESNKKNTVSKGMVRSTSTPYTTDNSLSSSSSHSEHQSILQQQLQNVHSSVQVLDYSDSLLSNNELSTSSPLRWMINNNGHIQHSSTHTTTDDTTADASKTTECVEEEVELNITGTVILP